MRTANGHLDFDGTRERRLAESALRHLSPDCDRDTWVRVGMAISSLGDDAFPMFDGWSRQSEQKYNEAACRSTWKSFSADARGGVNISTLYHLAKQAGWDQKQADRELRDAGRSTPPTDGNKASAGPASGRNGDLKIFTTLDDAIRWISCGRGKVTTSDYRNAEGDLVCVMVRVDRQGHKKLILPVRIEGGRYVQAGLAAPRPLYHLAEVMAADVAIVAEGEKACDALRGLLRAADRSDIAVTTSMHGAQSPAKSDWTPLRGKSVWVWPDNDDDGRKYRDAVARLVGTECREIVPDGVNAKPKGWDAADWLDERDAAEPTDLVAELMRLMDAAEPIAVQDERDHNAADDSPNGSEKPPRVTYEVHPLPELLTMDLSQEFLIDGLLVSREPCVIAGPSKSLKTSVMLDLAVSLAAGGMFLGCGFFRASRPVTVAVMSGESGLPTIQETLRRIVEAAHVMPSDIGDRLLISPDIPKFGHLDHTEAIDRLIAERGVEVLVIDPAYLAVPAGDNAANMFAMGEMLRGMADVCRRAGCMMILLHHSRKNRADEFEPMDLSDIAWSGFDQFARQWLTVNRRSPYERGTGYHELWLACGGSAGHSGLWGVNITEGVRTADTVRTWDVEVTSEHDARQEAEGQALDRRESERDRRRTAKLDRIRKDVAAAFRQTGGRPESKTRIAELAGHRGVGFDEVWGELLRAGKVESRTVQRENGREYEAYLAVYQEGNPGDE